MAIHPMAVVEPGARLGSEVVIGPFCYVQGDTEIGDGCELLSHVTVLAHTTLGKRCRVHAGAVLGGLPQDTGFKGDVSYARIGNDCVLREGVTINRGTKPGTATVVGDGCMLMANAHCAHNVQLGDNVTIANGTALAGYVTVGERAFMSGNITVHQFVNIGKLAMVGLSAVLTKDLPPFCTARPAMENGVGGMNIVGMRRAGMTAEARAAVKYAFKVLYGSGLNVTQAVAILEQGPGSPEVDAMLEFIRGSRRGICAGTLRRRPPLVDHAATGLETD
jgi:UDP-N-acetylglucosamine acyltransferase